jgi:nicotinamide mononucleotide adenylyltransferase
MSSSPAIPITKLSQPLLPASDPSTPVYVLVSCGSFSPVTNLHLLLFEQAKNYLMFTNSSPLDIVGGLMSPVHDAYGKKSLIPAPHRLRMCQLACKDSTWINVSEWELRQSGWSRTALTLEALEKHLNSMDLFTPKRPITCLLLCGADLVESFAVPDLWLSSDIELILSRGLAVLERSGCDLPAFIHNHELLNKYKQNIHLIPQTITNNISSTSVRNLIQQNLSIRYLVPYAVEQYIWEKELYGWNKEIQMKRKQNYVTLVNEKDNLEKKLRS